MESPRKFNDCYFYYYSTCIKGDNCVFRHEPSALGCETMCSAWQQGKCLDKRCKLRHMELRKNRKQIPCYWENQPGGCRKKHCPFMHKNPDARTDGIAPSHPAPPGTVPAAPEGGVEPALGAAPTIPAPAPAPAPVPLFWQQQRQVVLDPAILDALPASELVPRRLVPAHAHAHAHTHAHAHAHAHTHAHDAPPNPYAVPVDPLVVNFEEESDNESAASSTPTKTASAAPQDHELQLLERIQAEAAAFYSYEPLANNNNNNNDKQRAAPRTNLNNKYDKRSLDEIAGKKPAERRNSLDFKVLSLDEIRARKKTESIVLNTPITMTLNRKRKLSTQEAVTTSGDKIIKVVRSNSIVYKKLDHNAPATANQTKSDQKASDSENNSRKRTLSEQSDVYELREDELVDNCFEFKRIKVSEQTSKPRLIRNRRRSGSKATDVAAISNNAETDSDTEVQIVSIDISDNCTSLDISSDVIDVDSTKMGEPVDIVDLSDEPEECEIAISDYDLGLIKSVPDVVASCQKKTKTDNLQRDLLSDIDNILNDVL